jgi:hypothetical protein
MRRIGVTTYLDTELRCTFTPQGRADRREHPARLALA